MSAVLSKLYHFVPLVRLIRIIFIVYCIMSLCLLQTVVKLCNKYMAKRVNTNHESLCTFYIKEFTQGQHDYLGALPLVLIFILLSI
jgi:hypothetical protein